MKQLKILKLSICATGAALAIGSAVQAQSITVPNFSFETPTTGGFQDNSGISVGAVVPNTGNAWYYLGGFTASGSPVGVQNVAANGFSLGANPDGTQDGYVNVGAWMGSGALTAIAANTTYTLTVSEGNRGGGFAQTAGFTFALAYGATVGTSLTNSANWVQSQDVSYADSPTVGTFGDYSISFTTGSSDPTIGQSLFVLLGSDVTAGNNPVDYDNVRLIASPVPEPATLSLAALGCLAFLAVNRRTKKDCHS